MSALLEIRGLTSHYGRIQALSEIDLDIHEAELVALVGANGAGKSTLLRCISGVKSVSSGTIRFAGEDITRVSSAKRVALRITQSPEARQVFAPMSVLDNLLLGAYRRKDSGISDDLARMFKLFPVLDERKHQSAGTLSGGEQQMLAIARALMGRPLILLLDEPSMGLAPLIVAQILEVVQKLKAEGMTIFLVEQNANAALAIADRGYVLETGRIVMSGTGPELLADPRVQQAYLGI